MTILEELQSDFCKHLTEFYQNSLKNLPHLTDFSPQFMACMYIWKNAFTYLPDNRMFSLTLLIPNHLFMKECFHLHHLYLKESFHFHWGVQNHVHMKDSFHLHSWLIPHQDPLDQVMQKRVLCHMRTTKSQISLRIRAVWSAPLLFAA